jgi:undecaprenyl pyrophosphate phosphatase UppP
MIKMILAFISLFVIFFVSIDLFRKFTKKEQWKVVKMASYSLIISILVIIVLTTLVVLF